ncbi:TrbI/VirB10 family protein [Sphingopyxis witflariensis]|uniref:Conjugal transfer protein TraI n=1 Tax=Sphingopyxis witflariensis TaxID=173675 RepID=A0A246JYR8_9SPHN|nr:TrbI/VirB10 family protein [Sphingopyxis witflariensis]OWQ98327.1 conjugal transfer protein TraI [Sphingopyxis witflariensis]
MTEREDQAVPPAEEPGNENRAAQPPAVDAFRLRGEPPRVMRLSRKTLASIGAAGGVAIGGALLWALQPSAPKSSDNLYSADTANRVEVVTGAPADYGKVPKLGPPLPGDLGRPIVAAQRDGEIVPVPPMGSPSAAARSPADEARDRARQKREAATTSRLFLGGGSAGAGMAEALRGSIDPVVAAPAPVADERSPVAARRAFLEGGAGKPNESPERIGGPSSPYILQAGSLIPAALITGIRSDLPGQVTAQVTQNVYDSPTGRILLIPQGARLIGDYDSEIAAGQERVLLAWDRLILPGGRSIRLDRQPGTDARGMAGLADRTDHHWGSMLRAALVSTLLGVGAELGSDGDDAIVRALRDGSQDTINQSGRRLVERQMNIPPTLTIRPGFALRVLVTRDLILEPENSAP